MGAVAPSEQLGMGAIVFPGGTAFRVWAPHAKTVHVAGEFNHWSATANPLARDGEGYWSADVPRAECGQEYKYVFDGEHWRTDPYAHELAGPGGNARIRDTSFDWNGDSFPMPAWNALVLYEMHVGTFTGQTNADGTFAAAGEKLDQLADMGVNAIEILPPTETKDPDTWGYNVSHLFAIRTDYRGDRPGQDAYKAFVRTAHRNGLAVIQDVVYSHLGPDCLDLWRFDGWSRDGEDNDGGIYFYDPRRAATPWGHTRPDYRRPEVRQYLRSNALNWLRDYHVDGLRFDAVSHIRYLDGIGEDVDQPTDLPDGWAFLQELNRKIRTDQPGKISIAEDLRGDARITQRPADEGAGFGTQWDPDFLHTIRGELAKRDEDRDIRAIARVVQRRIDGDAFGRVIYMENHDEVCGDNCKARLPVVFAPDDPAGRSARKRSALAAVLLLSSPGIPMLFQGQEYFADKPFDRDGGMDWALRERRGGAVRMFRDLIRLRTNTAGRTAGLMGQGVHVHHVNDEAKVLAFHRWDRQGPRDSTIVLVNLAERAYDAYELGLPREGKWTLRFGTDWEGYAGDFQDRPSTDIAARLEQRDGMPCTGAVPLGPYAAAIFSQED